MIEQLMRLLQGRDAPAAPTEDDLRMAVAALLVEAARMDASFDSAERSAVSTILAKRFGLSGSDVASLVSRADTRIQDTAQYFPFTHSINTRMSAEQKAEVIEMLWQVAYVDGELDPEEDRLIRQIAGLIHVTDRERMLARRRVLDGTGGETEH